MGGLKRKNDINDDDGKRSHSVANRFVAYSLVFRDSSTKVTMGRPLPFLLESGASAEDARDGEGCDGDGSDASAFTTCDAFSGGISFGGFVSLSAGRPASSLSPKLASSILPSGGVTGTISTPSFSDPCNFTAPSDGASADAGMDSPGYTSTGFSSIDGPDSSKFDVISAGATNSSFPGA